MPEILSKKYTITDPQEQASDIDDMFDDLYRQVFDAVGTRMDEGDTVIVDENGNLIGLPLGTVNGAFLRVGTTAPEWSTLILPNAAAIGDLLYGSAANVLSRLADVATGSALISGGVGVAPSWGQIGLTTHVTGILPVANGGTGRASHTAYAVLCGGTTGTGAQQSVAGVGTAGQVLTSNGAAALPTFQTFSALPTVQTTSVTGAQANFELNGAFTYLRCTNASTVTFSGFTGPAGNVFDGYMAIINATNANVQILHQNVGSTSFYRCITPANTTITLTIGEQAIMVYEASLGKWHCAYIGTDYNESILFDTDATYDIGAIGASRPNSIYVSNRVTSNTLVIDPASSGYIWFNGRSLLRSEADGDFTLLNTAETSFGRVNFGGTSSSFPALKRSTTFIEVKLADDSAYTNLKALEFYLTSGVYLMRSTATMTNGAGALTGTLTNSPVTGDPTKWLKFDDNGTVRWIPSW